MQAHRTKLQDVLLLEPRVFEDVRGSFHEVWRTDALRELGIEAAFVQENQSTSKAGVVRGLHYQVEHPQGKLIRVIDGAVLDVAVDLRRSSSTFGQWEAFELSAENRRLLWLPPGFAHGFAVRGEGATLVYLCTDAYFPSHERTILWNDPDLAIDWPLTAAPIVSGKDQAGLAFRDAPTLP